MWLTLTTNWPNVPANHGKPVLVNMSNVACVVGGKNGCLIIWVDDADGMQVQESYDQIAALIAPVTP